MKLNFNFLALVCLLLAGTSSLVAQTAVGASSTDVDQVSSFNTSYMDAYNRADIKALVKHFTADAERTDGEGTAIAGTDNLEAHYANALQSGKWKLMLRAESATRLADGTVVATGSYKATNTNADGTTEVRTGTYRNELVRKDKQLLIRKMKLFKSL
jgi:ketosteroid isomerase-like protein